MKKQLINALKLTLVMAGIFAFTSCSMVQRSTQEADSHIRFVHENFEYSTQVTGEATTVRILGIDWKRLFKKGSHATADAQKGGGFDIANVPVIGNVMREKTYNLALYDLLNANGGGYDVVMYPQYEMSKKGFPGIYTKTVVKATARLAKLKK